LQEQKAKAKDGLKVAFAGAKSDPPPRLPYVNVKFYVRSANHFAVFTTRQYAKKTKHS